jgi:hypothetical protein
MKKKVIKVSILCLSVSIILSSCISTARISDFSSDSASIDFEKYTTELKTTSTPSWLNKKSNEYYFEINKNISKDRIDNVIQLSFLHFNYTIKSKNLEQNNMIGKKGIGKGLNEWRTITGIYYKQTDNLLKVYVKSKITQDVTGGLRENRALKIGEYLEAQLKLN